MKNKNILLYIIIAIFSYFTFYKFFDIKPSNISQKNILKLNKKLWENKIKLYTLSTNYNYLWLKNSKQQSIQNISQISKKDLSICIDKKCFHLLAIIEKNGIKYASFYAKSFPKNHIKLFTKQTYLYKDFFITSITNDNITIHKKKTKQSWIFFLFDVNTTKYKPKDNNETYL